MKIIKSIDDKLEEIGFKKIRDNEYIVSYERELDTYTQTIDICHKANNNHIVQSYDKNLFDNRGIGNVCVGLTYYEMKLILKKMKKKGWNK